MSKKDEIAFYGAVNINGLDQWISVRGDKSKPLILILHGGPGTPCMSLFRKKSEHLLDDFLVATFDQRGTGRSHYKNIDVSTLTVAQIVKDIHAVTEYLKKEYSKDKIYLMGHSFGATVGLQASYERPQDYHAYLGVSQFINTTKNEQVCYDMVKEIAEQKGNKKDLAMLEAIGTPVDGFYKGGLKHTVKVKQLVDKYKGSVHCGSGNAEILLSILFSREYGLHRFPNAIAGINTSLTHIGNDLKGIEYDVSIKEMKIPVYFFSGKYDMLTPQSILHDFYKNLKAPKKELYTFENSAHNLLWEETDKFAELVKGIVE